jgi:trigger factor
VQFAPVGSHVIISADDSMKVNTDLTEDCQAILSIEAEPEEMEESLGLAYRKLVMKVNVPGFRKGKVPRDLFERYVGRGALIEEAIEHLVPELYTKAIEEANKKAEEEAKEEAKLEPIADPHIDVLEVDPVSFKATVPLRPIVEIGDYRKTRVASEEVEVTEEEMSSTMEQIRDRQAVWEPVDRAVEFDDVAVIDIQIQEEVEGGTPRDFQSQEYPVSKEAEFPLPGFAEELVGLNRGDEKEFRLTFPDNWGNKDLVGKQARFNVKVLEVKEKRVPEWSDDLVKSMDAEVDTVDALRERVAKDLQEMAERDSKRRFEENVIDAVGEAGEVKFPPILVEREIDDIIQQQTARFGVGEGAREMYLKVIGKTEEELRKELAPSAAQQVRRSLIVGRVSVEENIQIDASEIDAEIETIAKAPADPAAELHKVFGTPQGRRVVEQTLLFRKAKERLIEIASSPPESEEDSSQQVESEDNSSPQVEGEEASSSRAEEDSGDNQDSGEGGQE